MSSLRARCSTLVGMSTFDESKHPRRRGRFAPVSHGEPEVTVGSGPGFDARYWGLPTHRPGSWVFGDDACAEIAAGFVLDGPLSRGVATKESADAFSSWQAYAAGHGSSDGDEFAAGLEDGLRALVGADGEASTEEMLDAIAERPTGSTPRVNWMLGIRPAATKARGRGRLAAGVILSGADEWWGIADNRELALVGSPNPKPRARGAWAFLAG